MTGTIVLKILSVWTLAVVVVPLASADLRSYVQADDGGYRWEPRAQTDRPDGLIVHELQLTSQVWQGIPWRHRLQVLTPRTIPDMQPLVLLLITGTDPGEQEVRNGQVMAQALRAPVAILHDVPNQPLFGGLVEDALLAYTFVQFLDTQDPTWPLLLPMVKSVVRAMDAVQAFLQRERHAAVSGFVVSGASKRGWTTWLTPVVDERVKAIAPLVYDNLNLAQQLRHQRATWGDVSGEITDYTTRGLPQRLLAGEKRAQELAALVDPFSYRQQLTLPKLIILGTNDRYWPLDAFHLYADALLGERYFLYLANAGHTLLPGRKLAVAGLMALFQHTAGRLRLPTLRWEAKAQASTLTLALTSDQQPQAVRVWMATAPTTDFREARWEAFTMHREPSGYIYRHAKRSRQLTALFGEAEYAADSGPFVLTTTVSLFR